MSRWLKRIDDCLEVDELEEIILGGERVPERYFRVNHVQDCFQCSRRSFRLRVFYQILFWELNKPVSRQVKNLVKQIQEN